MTRISPASRESDERCLRWLRLRSRMSANRAAKVAGVAAGALIIATNNVAQADWSESGEDVSATYPWYAGPDA